MLFHLSEKEIIILFNPKNGLSVNTLVVEVVKTIM